MKFEDVKKVAVLGSGTMGHGIAQRYAMGGYEVNMYDIADEPLKNAVDQIRKNFEIMVEGGMVKAEDVEPCMARITTTTDLKKACEGCQLIQETVPEKPQIKKSVFEEIDGYLGEDVLIVSNTSALDPFVLMPERRLPYFCTAHWFAPPHILPLVECAVCDKTKEETVETVMQILEKCGKVAVKLDKFIPGHLMSRIMIALNDEIFSLIDNGIASPEMIDKAAKASFFPRGMAVGLVQRYDFTGLDISCNNLMNRNAIPAPHTDHPKQLFDLYDRGDLGVKTGKGFFDYSGRDQKEVLAERDKRLIQVVNATFDIMDKPV